MQAVMNNAAMGMSAAMARFEASARRTAERPLDNLAGELIEQRQAEIAFSANAMVARTADRMMKALLDIKA